MSYLLQTPTLKEKNNFLLASHDEHHYCGSLEETSEFEAILFHPHPNEERLSFTKSCSLIKNESYYEDALCEDLNTSLVTDFVKNLNFYIDEYVNQTGVVKEKYFTPLNVEFLQKAINPACEAISLIAERLVEDNPHPEEFAADSTLFELIDDIGDDLTQVHKDLVFQPELKYSIEGLKEIVLKLQKTLYTIVEDFKSEDDFETKIHLGDMVLDLVVLICELEFKGFEPATGLSFTYLNNVFTAVKNNLYFNNPNVTLVSVYEHSGICLQWSSTCPFDSTSGAAIILGNDELKKGIFELVDNILQDNYWAVTHYELVKLSDVKKYPENTVDDLEDLKLDNGVLNVLLGDKNLESQYGVIEYETIGGFLTSYLEWERAGIFDHFEPENHKQVPFEIESESYIVEISVGKEYTNFEKPEGSNITISTGGVEVTEKGTCYHYFISGKVRSEVIAYIEKTFV